MIKESRKIQQIRLLFEELIKQGAGYFVGFKKQVGKSLDREMVFLRFLIRNGVHVKWSFTGTWTVVTRTTALPV